jgi:hypothetical protein
VLFVEQCIWEADVAQSDYMSSHKLTRQCFDCFGLRVLEGYSLRQAILDETTGGSRIKRGAEQLLAAYCANGVDCASAGVLFLEMIFGL